MTKGKFQDLAGHRFGKLLVLNRAENRKRHVYWKCQCDCGQESEIAATSLRSSATRSCGCELSKHDLSRTTEHNIWLGMRTRCRNPKVNSYPNYGGRGIKVCARWDDFENFLADVGPRPSPKHSLERNDSNGDYEPNNVRWATAVEQVNNRRNTRYVTYRSQQMPLAEAVRAAGSIAHIELVWFRISKAGWAVELALETPAVRPRLRGAA